MMKYCYNCGARIKNYIPEKTRYCSNCGARFSRSPGLNNGMSSCGICHKRLNVNSIKVIKCVYCDAVFHESCIYPWLTKYNACPSCQNVYLMPKLIQSL